MRILLLRILLELRLITQLLNSIGSGRNSNNVLIGQIILLRPPVGHHTDFLIFLSWKVVPESLCTAGRGTFLN